MNTKTIILVEDNPAEARLAKLAFQEMAIPNPTIHYSNGYQLLQHLEENGPHNIAFILLDLNMPEINGKEVLRTIQENRSFKSLPILIYSSSGYEDEIEECYALGAKAYIRKPMDFYRFKEILQKTYDFWIGTSITGSRAVQY